MSRTRQSIIATGINTADPCMIVKDGTCEDILNMRYKHNSLNAVGLPQLKYSINDSSIFSAIIGMVSFLPEGHFIAITKTEQYIPAGKPMSYIAEVYEVKIINNTITPVTKIITIKSISDFESIDLKMFQFGNTLFFNCNDSEQVVMYKNNTYVTVDLKKLKPTQFHVKINTKGTNDDTAGLGGLAGSCLVLDWTKGIGINDDIKEFSYNVGVANLTSAGYIDGGFKMFVAYRMFDGSIIKPSCPIYVGTPQATIYEKRINNTGETPNLRYYISTHYLTKPTITIAPITDICNDLIKDVVVFASRNIPEYDFEKIKERFPKDALYDSKLGASYAKASSIFNGDCTKIDEPFYEVDSLPIKSSTFDKTTIELDYEKHFKDIEHKSIFKPSYSNHDVIGVSKFDYNSRVHNYGCSMNIFTGYNIIPVVKNDADSEIGYTVSEIINNIYGYRDNGVVQYVIGDSVTINIDTTIVIENREYQIRRTSTNKVIQKADGTDQRLAIFNLLAYPDTRATKIRITTNTSSAYLDVCFNLNTAVSNNYAYNYIDNGTKLGCLPIVTLLPINQIKQSDIEFVLPMVAVDQQNKLYVSALNNPFYFSPSNIYTIGSNGNIINGVECVADQISETKFGVFPLYVFTSKGTYALEIGDNEVLYKSVIQIDNETKSPQSLTASAFGNVFYVGKRGVMALSGRKCELISSCLETYPALQKNDVTIINFEVFIKEASLLYNPTETELIVYNTKYPYAYIFSLENKQWTRREWCWTNLSSQGWIISKNEIRNFWSEDNNIVDNCRLTTRPIKLDSLEFKRLETFATRMQCDSGSRNTWVLEGSNDLINWGKLITSSSPILRRITSSYKYYRIQFSAEHSDYLSITHFDVEYYLRFVGKLR